MTTKQVKVVRMRLAGDEHAVVTLEGGRGDVYRREPCPQCPWRVDATGVFPPQAFVHSAATAYDLATHVFSCHESGQERPATCAGFLLKGAEHNLTVRMRLFRGELDPGEVSDGGHDLYESYAAMAVGNGVDPADPALEPCRDARSAWRPTPSSLAAEGVAGSGQGSQESRIEA